MSPRPGGEAGAATVLVLAMMGLLCFVMVGLAAGVGVVGAQRLAQSAADLAALAGAQALADGSDGCGAAAEVAAANGTALTECLVTGRQVRVSVQVPNARWLGREVQVVAEARAGPA